MGVNIYTFVMTEKGNTQKPNRQIKEIEEQKSISELKEEYQLISDDKVASYYEEAIKTIKEDREEASEKFDLMFDEIINGGDATTSSKEMATNFFNKKVDATDKMIKILDLWTRIKLKEKNTMPDYLKARQNIKNQQNNYNIHTSPNTTKLMDMVDDLDLESKDD